MTPSGLLAGIAGTGAGDGDVTLAVPPPPSFTPAGVVGWAKFASAPGPERPVTGLAQKAGVRYEKKAIDHLRSVWPDLRSNPWIQFHDGRLRWCRPDVLYRDNGDIYIVEIKIQHMPEAYYQLRQLYAPVVRKLYPKHRIVLLEMCKSYDPSMPFPEAHLLLKTIKEARHVPEDTIGVLPWKD